MVNIACKSNFVQEALTNLLVALEASNCSKAKKCVGHEGYGMMAHQERGVEPIREEDSPHYVSNASAHSTSGTNRREAEGDMECDMHLSTLCEYGADKENLHGEDSEENSRWEKRCVENR